MDKKYEKPVLKVEFFDCSDVISASNDLEIDFKDEGLGKGVDSAINPLD